MAKCPSLRSLFPQNGICPLASYRTSKSTHMAYVHSLPPNWVHTRWLSPLATRNTYQNILQLSSCRLLKWHLSSGENSLLLYIGFSNTCFDARYQSCDTRLVAFVLSHTRSVRFRWCYIFREPSLPNLSDQLTPLCRDLHSHASS